MPHDTAQLPGPLPFRELDVLATSLARRYARNPDDVEDLKQEGLWAWVQAMRRGHIPQQPHAFARTVMQRRMLLYYKRLATLPAGDPLPYDLADEDSNPLDNRLDLECYFHALEVEHSLQARRVVENLIAATDPQYCRELLGAQWAKQLAHANHQHVTGLHKVRPSPVSLRRSLGLDPVRWRILLADIQEFTRQWMGRYPVYRPGY